jgi:hypothetical protein
MTRLTGLAAVLVLAALLPLSGCTTAAKHAFYEVRGAQGSMLYIDDLDADELRPCQSVRFEPATTTIGSRLCPPAFLHEYDRAAQAMTEKLRDQFPGGPPVLTITGDVLYFQKKGLLSGAQSLVRTRFTVDGRLLADAIVRVESRAFREGDHAALAEETIDTIGKALRRLTAPPDQETPAAAAAGYERASTPPADD